MTDIDRDLYNRVTANIPTEDELDPDDPQDDTARAYWRGYQAGIIDTIRAAAERVPGAPTPQQADDIIDLLIARAKTMGIEEWLDGQRSVLRSFLAQFETAVRQPVSDEELARTAWRSMPAVATVDGTYSKKRDWPDGEANDERVMFARAVRNVLGPAVPVIPEGWRFLNISTYSGILGSPDEGIGYRCLLAHPRSIQTVDGTGPTWQDALTAAIAAAKEGER